MIHRHGTTKRYSDTTEFAGVVYLVEVPGVEEGDITVQTESLLANTQALLKQADSDRSLLLQVQIYLTDMSDYDGFNAVWDAWVPENCAPVRACVQVNRLAKPGWRVELVAIAAKRESSGGG